MNRNRNRRWTGSAAVAALIGLAPVATADTEADPFEDLFGTAGINSWTMSADSSLLSADPALAGSLDASVESFLAAGPANFGEDFTFSEIIYNIDPGAFAPDNGYLFSSSGELVPLDLNGELAMGLDYSIFASGLSSTVDPFVLQLDQLAQLPQEIAAFLVILGIPLGI